MVSGGKESTEMPSPGGHPSAGMTEEEISRLNARLANPLAGMSLEQLQEMGAKYARENGMEEYEMEFRKGAMLAQDRDAFETIPLLTDEERDILRREVTHRWSHPMALYHMVIMCSVAAAVQGMDESVINGANLYFFDQFGIQDREWIKGLVNSAPYLCCFTIGCWLTHPLNQAFGRRNTIFITCLISFATCFWQAFTNTWWHLFIARFFLGFGIGPKSSTVPVYAAECSPPAIRGALVMMWQMWTAFGIMLGYVCDVAFMNVKTEAVPDLNWRMMLASAAIPAIFVCAQVYFCPESPRYELMKGRPRRAFDSLARLRWSKVQAARDLFYMKVLLEAEGEMAKGIAKLKEMFTVGRNRRAMQASQLVMFMQQFCGINVIAYYSSSIFADAGFSHAQALLASMGFGIINWLFALPAVFTIDRFGRRNLLLTTFPLMSLALLFTGFCFWIPGESTARVACVALGIYLFAMVYSPGEGPVPFTYSAEAYPLYIRDIGMSLATATTWGFNFILAVTWFALEKAFTTQGAFAWYAGWNIVGFFGVLFLLPETKGKTLEELDQVFSVPTRVHARYGARQIPYFFKRYVLWQNVEAPRLSGANHPPVEYHESTFAETKESSPERRV
ncbi:hypothetical protein BZA05DRAFT_442672 [Tricharina praecox]|uniref:uncharacterized protein n=1 Tax=Tricharina praecox TaxID=43433 RepID=UPI002220DC4B|nr:uncharacterized protein BZA05DRAFT_442672 [Tricharina praecox]KAI5856005.1 hypothetical protein BZA05DRAFT_442672 [Tricharina praecox]